MHPDDVRVGDTCKVNEFRIKDRANEYWTLKTSANREVVKFSIKFLKVVFGDSAFDMETLIELLQENGFYSNELIPIKTDVDFEL